MKTAAESVMTVEHNYSAHNGIGFGLISVFQKKTGLAIRITSNFIFVFWGREMADVT